MADPVQKTAPANDGVEWDAPATVQTGTPAPPDAAPSTANSNNAGGVEWDAPTPPSSDTQDQGVLHGLYTHTVQPFADAGSVLKKLYDEPTWEGQRKIVNDTLLGIAKSQAAPYVQGADELQHARDDKNASFSDRAANAISGVTHVAESAVPFLGPMTADSQNAIEKGRTGEGIGNAMGDVLTAATPHLAEAGLEKINTPANLANSTPRRALAGLIAKAPGMGDNFEPEAVAASVEPLIQQAAQADPETAKIAEASKDPKEAYKAFQKLANNAQVAIDTAHRQVLSRVSNTPVSVRPVLEAMDASMPQSLDKFAPDDAAAIKGLRANIANAKTLGDLNGLRVYLNTELSPEFKMDNVAVGRTAALDKAMRAALGATKDAYYDNLQHVTGQDFRSLKMAESNLMTYQEALANSRRGQFAAQAEFKRPTTAKQKVATVGEMAGAVMHGDKGKIARTILREAPMEQTHANIQQVMKGVPKGGGFSVETGAEPQPLQLGTGSGIEEGDDTYQHEKGAPARPSVVTPFQNRPLLPETAGQGLVTEPVVAQPHPGVNEPTASTRVRQPIFKKPEPTPARTITVSPEGTATVQRPALPAPPAKVKTLKTRKILSGG